MSAKVTLTEDEREALVMARYFKPSEATEEAVESIVAARVAEALRYAADGCTDEADRQWVHTNANEYDPDGCKP